MKQSNRLKKLYNAPKNVFSAKELKQIWRIEGTSFKKTVQRMVNKELLYRIVNGIYTIKQDFDPFELANTLVVPSYISLNSALTRSGVAFQSLTTINSIATYTYTREIKNLELKYYKIKDEIFNDKRGIRKKENYIIASPERAICDSFYLGFLPNIDNPNELNWVRFERISKIYPKTVQKKVKKLIKNYGLQRIK
jgi:predicted transcriptional regulator of viral defense system